MAWPLQAAATKSSVRSLTSTVDPSASRNTAWAPGPVRTDSRSPMAAPASRVPAATRYRPPSAETTVARGPPGAIMASMVSRPTYTTAMSSAAAAASMPRRTQREEDRTGMAMTVLSPFISAIRVRQLGQRLRWSSTKRRRLAPSSLPRYARKSWRNSAQTELPAFVTFSQTRARAVSIVPASTSSVLISCSARSKRSSDIANLLSTACDSDCLVQGLPAFAPWSPGSYGAL